MDISESHRSVMNHLNSRLDELTKSIPRQSRIIYLDYPVHYNVGDMLINRGAESFFTRMEYKVLGRLSLLDICGAGSEGKLTLRKKALKFIRKTDPSAIVVLHGGGNFGDLYPQYQVMRELLVDELQDRRIVMLPQSAHFSSQRMAEVSFRQLAKHGDIHLYFRDMESLALARQSGFENAQLLPDMAHALYGQLGATRSAASSSGLLSLRRKDKEGTSWKSPLAPRTEVDWEMFVSRRRSLLNGIVNRIALLKPQMTYAVAAWLWYAVRDEMIQDAIDLFEAHAAVVTDRLHAVILAALLDRPVTYIDNSYGKLSRYASAFLANSPLIRPLEV